jgi:hypothetical protein
MMNFLRRNFVAGAGASERKVIRLAFALADSIVG